MRCGLAAAAMHVRNVSIKNMGNAMAVRMIINWWLYAPYSDVSKGRVSIPVCAALTG